MIEITSFLLKHLYELMADDYTTGQDRAPAGGSGRGLEPEPSNSGETSALLMRLAEEDEISPAQLLGRLNDDSQQQTLAACSGGSQTTTTTTTTLEEDELVLASSRRSFEARESYLGRAQQRQTNTSREQETNQQIVSFLANNHLPDLICETFIELLFICVFLAVTWIFVMIVQLHCHQLQQPARLFYCNTKFLSSLMYCNNKSHLATC